ncbi:MAG: hypothetical protein IJS30_03095 [Bacteroidales bacterium]|nr:hypothetical protein [Bacteroidales bacterium]
MKKYFRILIAAAVCLSGLAACTPETPVGEMARNISVAPGTQQVATDGQSFEATITADGAWVADTPDWISVSPANGEGNQTVKVTVAPNDGGARTDAVKFYSAVGNVSSTSVALESTPLAELTVTQAAGEGQSGDNTISIADYLALGANTDAYIITGTITRVANTKYGNFDLTDETGTIYVYGLLNEELEAQKCWADKELALGDVLTVQANTLQFYEKDQVWEIVNAVYVSHKKSLFDLESDNVTLPKEGGDFEVKAVVKGEDVKADYEAGWITFKGAVKDGENVTLTFTAAENAGMGRSAVMTLSTTSAKGETSTAEFTVNQEGNILTVTVADFLAAEESDSGVYELVGTIEGNINTTYGNFNLTDATGTVYVYGLTATELGYGASNDRSFASLGLRAGDVIKLRGYRSSHNGTPQVKSAWFIEKLASGPIAATVAEFLAAEESDAQVYVLTGTMGGNINNTYGNFDLTDETGTVYVYGLTATELGYGAKNDKSFASLGLKEGDVIKIRGYRSSHNGTPQVKSAWFIEKLVTEEDPGNAVVITDAQLPAAYPEAEATFTEGDYEYSFLKVANYGTGIQMQGKKNSFIANKTAMPSDIKSVTVNCHPDKTYYQGNLKVYAGNAENPAGDALTGTLSEDGKSETFAVPEGCKFFKVVNESNYAVYLSSISIEL